MSRKCFCYDCGYRRNDVSEVDEDGFCGECGSDNVFGYDTDEIDREVAKCEVSK